eukprot:1013064-Alexandrium_andersonii.AAC.1
MLGRPWQRTRRPSSSAGTPGPARRSPDSGASSPEPQRRQGGPEEQGSGLVLHRVGHGASTSTPRCDA